MSYKLNEELTKEQEDYFKNSKVRDNKDNLLICYHGTSTPGFKEFNPKDNKSQFGKYKFNSVNVNYFTTNRKSAGSYGDLGYEHDGNVYACYINIENPFIVDNKNISDIRSSFNIKDDRVRKSQLNAFSTLWNKYGGGWIEESDIDDVNKYLRILNYELRPSSERSDNSNYTNEEGYYDLYSLGNNSAYGNERPVLYAYTLEELFDEDMYDELYETIVGDEDDYYLSTDDIVKYVLYSNEYEGTDYDGIIIEDIIDSKDMFSDKGTDIITLKSSNQIKLIDNEHPTSSNKIDEDVYDSEGNYYPPQDSRYKRLLSKPINTLSTDDIAYLFTINATKYGAGRNSNGSESIDWRTDLRGWDNNFYKGLELEKDKFEEEFEKAHEHFSKLQFPLKVYRALREDEDTPSGKNHSLSWTTDINLYKANNSIFRDCKKIVEAKITSDMIQNEWTIVNYVYYSARTMNGSWYPESEITLKPRFKFDKLTDYRIIDKNKIDEWLKEEINVEVDNQGNELSKEQVKFFKDSQVRDEHQRLYVCYHGTSQIFKDDEFKSAINWFSVNDSYSTQFANNTSNKVNSKIYQVYLNCKNVFDCGDTDYFVFKGQTSQERADNYIEDEFSDRFLLMMNKLGLQGDALVDFMYDFYDEVSADYDDNGLEGYASKLKAHYVTRTKTFKELVQLNKYDAISTFEDSAKCFGVFKSNDIKLITNKKPTLSNKMNEHLTNAKSSVKLSIVDALNRL